MIYLDTSALVKLYVLEAGSEFVQSCLSEQDDPLPIWELQEAELANALHLKVFRNEWTEAEATRHGGGESTEVESDGVVRRGRSGCHAVMTSVNRSHIVCIYTRGNSCAP